MLTQSAARRKSCQKRLMRKRPNITRMPRNPIRRPPNIMERTIPLPPQSIRRKRMDIRPKPMRARRRLTVKARRKNNVGKGRPNAGPFIPSFLNGAHSQRPPNRPRSHGGDRPTKTSKRGFRPRHGPPGQAGDVWTAGAGQGRGPGYNEPTVASSLTRSQNSTLRPGSS